MIIVCERVKEAKVEVGGKTISEIKQGLLLLVGFTHDDSMDEVKKLTRKVANLRIFSDEFDKLNLNISDVKGEILSISQFTVYGDLKKSNRPSFTKAKNYEEAKELYLQFNKILNEEYKIRTLPGVFGENMQVSLTNDGPVTIIMDSEKI
jgi:D-aminoacyl-tRNA deacylase